MNYFLLAETEFFRRINEAGDCDMETAYMAFATQVIELCDKSPDLNRTIIALAYIEIELLHHPVRTLSDERKEMVTYINKALSFVRKMQKFLSASKGPACVSNRTSTDDATEATDFSLRWTGNSTDLVELIYGICEMGCINDGEASLKEVSAYFYKMLGVQAKACYHIYNDIKTRKNDSRTYFLDRAAEKVNRRMRMDEEREMRRR